MKRPILLALGLCALACNLDPGKEPWTPGSEPAEAAPLAAREPCARHDPLRQPLYGDLHVHTGRSMDAWIRELRSSPEDAYRFARGEAIGAPPYDQQGRPSRTIRIDRPLDFAAVTDHAEWLGELRLCEDAKSPVYDSQSCRVFRGEETSLLGRIIGTGGSSFIPRLYGVLSLFGRNAEVCGEDAARCRAATKDTWQENQEAAERFYDRSEHCSFTTFHAFEYSRSPSSTKIHRNVIFRNEIVPELPISWIDTPTEPEFWAKLRQQCNDTGSGCDAIAIPHNPNLSNGQQFRVWYRDLPEDEQREQASLRRGLEPIVEMVQYKGESECRNGFHGVVGGPDELCDFEKIRDMSGQPPEDCEEGSGSGAQRGRGCTSRLDYVRYALIEGLREEQRIGVNPYVFGFIGSTDTHLGNPGAVDERSFEGKFPSDVIRRLTVGDEKRPEAFASAGALAGVYAEENSRDSIFAALARREAFATSGPRIAPRFFAGADLPDDLCRRSDALEVAYARGVPMGGVVTANAATIPRFFAQALRDPRGAGLERLQIVKVWLGDDDAFHQRVHDVAQSEAQASVDVATCTLEGSAADALCATFVDPDFDPNRDAVYYARVVEQPTCRWTTWACNALAEAERPDGCNDARIPKTIQERAWTSPIWVDAQ